METSDNNLNDISPIKIVRENRLVQWVIDFKGVWFALFFFGFLFFGWKLLPYLPFILPNAIEQPYSYPPFSLTKGEYTLELWHPKMMAPGKASPLIYTVTAQDTGEEEQPVSVENSLAKMNTSIQSTPRFNQLKFAFSNELGNQDQEIVKIQLPPLDSEPAEVHIQVTLKTPAGKHSEDLMIPVAQVGWINYWLQVLLLAISGAFTVYSNFQPALANIWSFVRSRRDFQN
jgi:hypothetical protein